MHNVRLRSRRHSSAAGVLVALLLAGCSLIQSPPSIDEPMRQLAVLPITRSLPRPNEQTKAEPVPEKAGSVITAQVYDVLAGSPEWRFVPDIAVAQALTTLDKHAAQPAQARALGKAVGATGVLYGTVTRFRQREGSAYGVTRPASVAFDLQLVSVTSGEVLWRGTFDQTQEPLSWNLFNWWQFWKAGPRWLTAEELAHFGVERLLGRLSGEIQWE